MTTHKHPIHNMKAIILYPLIFFTAFACQTQPQIRPMELRSLAAPPPYLAKAVLVCSMTGADIQGNSDSVTVAGYNEAKYPERHIGLHLDNADPLLNALTMLLSIKSYPFTTPEGDTPNASRYFALAKDYLENHTALPKTSWRLNDGSVATVPATAVFGHSWGPEGWRPTTTPNDPTMPAPGDSCAFLLENKNTLTNQWEPFKQDLWIWSPDSSGKLIKKQIRIYFYVNIQRR